MQIIDVSHNAIRQPSSTIASPCVNLLSFRAEGNEFDGALEGIGKLSQLKVLVLSSNRLTALPPDFPSSLVMLKLNDNVISATLPATLGLLTGLVTLDLSGNLISGPLSFLCSPSATTDAFDTSLASLEYLSLSNNRLSSVVQDFQLPRLRVLKLAHNRFTGLVVQGGTRCGGAGHAGGALEYLDVSYNVISSPLPGALFVSSSALRTVIASINCFQGSLPAEICSSVGLKTLILDGMTMACGEVSKTTGVRKLSTMSTMSGQIPSCLFSLSNMSILHLSGNGLEGPMAPVSLSPALVDLTISYNRLTGPMSGIILQRLDQFHHFDVSFNRLKGNLLPAARPRPGADIFFLVNRLSGMLPQSLLSASAVDNLSILEANYFDCNENTNLLDPTSTGLPANDPYLDNFQCGSYAFNKYFYLLLALVVSSPCFLWLHKLYQDCKARKNPTPNPTPTTWARTMQRQPYFPSCLSGSALASSKQHGCVRKFLDLLLHLRIFAVYQGLAYLVLLVPIYVATSSYFGTHEQEYIYALSAAFKTGTPTACLFVVVWTALVLGSLVLLLAFVGKDLRDGEGRAGRVGDGGVKDAEDAVNATDGIKTPPKDARSSKFSYSLLARVAFVLIFNVVCVVGPNYLYIIGVTTLPVSGQIAAKISLAIFKFLWSNFILPEIFEGLLQDFLNHTGGDLHLKANFQCFLLVCNAFILPVLVSAYELSSCFKPVFKSQPTIVTTFEDYSCQVTVVVSEGLGLEKYSTTISSSKCLTSLATTEFTPPFLYNFQCSSDLLAIYAPPFLLVNLLSICEVVKDHVLLHLYAHLPLWWAKQLRRFLPALLIDTVPVRDSEPGGEEEGAKGGAKSAFWTAVNPCWRCEYKIKKKIKVDADKLFFKVRSIQVRLLHRH